MDLVAEKAVAIGVIAAAASLGAIAGCCLHDRTPAGSPACIERSHAACCGSTRSASRASWASISYLMSGGVLTAAALVHLLPESSETLSEAFPTFPVAHVLCGAGLLLTMAVESAGRALTECSADTTTTPPYGTGGHADSRGPVPSAEVSRPSQGASTPSSHCLEHGTVSVLLQARHKSGTTSQWMVALMVLGCLSFHSFVAGLALGIATDSASVLNILVAIAAHKTLATSALATALLRGGASWRAALTLLVCFALVTPLGIGVGMGLSEGLSEGIDGSPWAAGLLAFASGTFLHVGVVEMIVRETEHLEALRAEADEDEPQTCCSGVAVGYLATCVGFAAMSVLAFWV